MTTASLSPTSPASTTQDRDRLLQALTISLDAAGRSANTARLYEYGLRKLFAFLDDMGLGDVPLNSISREHLAHFLAAQRRRLSPASCQALHRSIRAFWKFLGAEGEVGEDVAKALSAPAAEEKVFDTLTDDNVDALRRACRQDRNLLGLRDELLIVFLLTTGARVAEAAAVQVENVDVRERRVLLRRGKGGSARFVGLEPEVSRVLLRYWRRCGITAGPAFLDRTGRQAMSAAAIYLAIRKRAKAAGLSNVTPHSFRRTCASKLLSAGMAEDSVRALLGWSRSSSMLSRYVAADTAERALEARRAVRLVR